MEVFRISHKDYSKKITSSGSSNRWNKEGQFVLYTGSSRSLSTLELVIHRNSIQPLPAYRMSTISIADREELFQQVKIKDLPRNWRTLASYSQLQNIGSKWYTKQETLILKVPSTVIQQEFNYIINIKHPDFKKEVALVRGEKYFWDERLFCL